MPRPSARLCAIAAVLYFSGTMCMAYAPDQPAVRGALQAGPLGLFSSDDFKLANGKCSDCATIPQALWYFQDEVIAVPKAGLPLAGFSTMERGKEDVRLWAASPAARTLAYPGVVWLGAPQVIEQARLGNDGAHLTLPDSSAMALKLAPKIASNRSYFDASSTAFFAQRSVRLRGSAAAEGGFTARTLWPNDFTIQRPGMALQPLTQPDNLRRFVHAQDGGAKSAYATRLIWERRPGAAAQWQGKPVLGIMLNGAQGDDDESLAGHFAVATGKLGPDGGMADWLVNNYYTLDAYGEKGTIAGIVPMDNYLADLNSGQAYYRPSYMLVAVLNNARTAQAYQGGAQRLYNHYYRHDFLFDGAQANCTGMSMDVFEALGWHVPKRGATHPIKALAAYPYKAVTKMSLLEGRKGYEYLNEEQIRLYPGVAFEAVGQDLLQLLAGTTGRTLSAYEQHLQSDVEALVLVRIPQIPSSRVFGSAPVYSYDEYMDRAPADDADWKRIPVPPRPFPAALKDGLALTLPERGLLPWPVAAAGALVLALLAAGALLLRRKLKKAVA